MPNKYGREFRCTRSDLYDDPNCPGFKDLGARQGHYIRANTKQEALATMARRYPNETFTCNEWEPVGNVTIRPCTLDNSGQVVAV